MTVTAQESTQTQAAFDRRLTLEELKARLSAISDSLSDARIDAGQLHKDVEELHAITRRIAWLADMSDRRGDALRERRLLVDRPRPVSERSRASLHGARSPR
jgi:hypothetical protein